MLHHLVQKYAGKETIVYTDTRPKCLAKKKALSTAQRKGLKRGRVVYVIVPAEDTNVKYCRPPHDPKKGGGDAVTPRLTKWD